MRKRATRKRDREQAKAPSALPASAHACAIAVAALILAPLGFFWRAAILRGFVAHSDICYFFEPVKALLHQSLRAGRLPLWSPYIYAGYPIAAEGQIATFYPLSLLISWLLPSPGAINWLIISHLIIAGISMYSLARLLGGSPFAAWLSGFVFSFSGYLFAHSHHISIICAAAWLPLVVCFVERAWRKGLLPNAVFAALAWAMSALSGSPQTTFHISLVIVFWVCWRLAQARKSEGRWRLARAGGVLGVVLALGAGLAAVQLLMTAELSATAPRGERGSLAYITWGSLQVDHLAGLIVPNWEGSPAFDDYTGAPYYWEYVLYVGLIPLALAAIGGVRREGWTLAGLGSVALWLALAGSNPLYRVLRFVPGFADFRVPARYILVFTFAAALLAGQGWATLAAGKWLRRGRRVVVVAALLALFTAADLMWLDRTLAPLSTAKVYAKPEAATALESDRSWWRALIYPPFRVTADWVPSGGWAVNPDGWAEVREALALDVNQSYRVRGLGGYAGLTDFPQTPFLRAAFAEAFGQHDYRLISLVGTRYLLLSPADPRLTPSGNPSEVVQPYAIYRNDAAFPRVFTVSTWTAVKGRNEAHLRVLELARQGRLGQEAAVTGDLAPFTGLPLQGAAEPRVSLEKEERRPERVVVHANADEKRLLVLNERYDRGWRAYCDGRPAPLVEVDTMLMGTLLPEGKHRVEFVYRPTSLVVGRAISLVSFGVCVVFLAVSPVVRRRRTPTA